MSIVQPKNPVRLAEHGFPWIPAGAGLAVLVIGMGVGHLWAPDMATGGVFTLSALVANGVFAALLGR